MMDESCGCTVYEFKGDEERIEELESQIKAMYEALTVARAYIELVNVPNDGIDRWIDMLKTINEAITKAEGV